MRITVMNNQNATLRRAIKAIWFILLVFVAPILPLVASWTQAPIQAELLALLPAWILWGTQLLYHQWDRFYLFANRAWLWITNTEVHWTMNLELICQEEDIDRINLMSSSILKYLPDANQWSTDNLSVVISLPIGGVIKIDSRTVYEWDEGDRVYSYNVQVSNFVVPFRHSNKALDQIAVLIEKAIEPAVNASRKKYVFKLNFGEQNPYFGLFVKRLKVPQQELVDFRCEFVDRDGGAEGRVDVGKDRLALTTTSLMNFKLLSERYVALASFDFDSF